MKTFLTLSIYSRQYIRHISFLLLLCVFSWSCKKESPQARLDSMDPSEGNVGDLVIINGSNLENRSGLYFGDSFIENQAISGDNKQLTVRVPDGLDMGDAEVYLMSEGEASNSLFFSVLPSIISVQPTEAARGEEIQIATNFTSMNAEVVFANNITAKEVAHGDYNIRVKVPEEATSGPLMLKLTGGKSAEFQDFIVKTPPVIDRFDPDWGWPGREVRVFGQNFLEGRTQVIFSPGKSAQITDISFAEMKVIVPDEALTGFVRVQHSFGEDSLEFSVRESSEEKPFVNQISPVTVSVGCILTITGGNFDPDHTIVTLQGVAGPIEISGSALNVSASRDEISFVVPERAISGEVVVTTSKGSSDAIQHDITEGVKLTRIVPQKNDLGGQVVLSVENAASVESVFFGDNMITKNNNAFEHFVYSQSGEEIIATNVPLNISNPSQFVYLEVSEGCFSDSLAFTVETNKISPNAPVAGGAHTVYIPSGTGGARNINNDWIMASGDLRDVKKMILQDLNFFYCYCEDPSGQILIYRIFGDCNDSEIPPCAQNPEFFGQKVVGRVSPDGSLVEIDGKYIGKFDDKFAQYGVTTIVLNPVDYGDQIEISRPGFIYELEPRMGPRGTVVTFKGRFLPPDKLRGRQLDERNGSLFTYKTYDIPITTISAEEYTFRIPSDIKAGDVPIKFESFPEFDTTFSFIITPKITTLTPDEGPVNTSVMLQGDFPIPHPLNTVSVDYYVRLIDASGSISNPDIDSLTQTKVWFKIPANLNQGEYQVDLETSSEYYNANLDEYIYARSNAVSFTIK